MLREAFTQFEQVCGRFGRKSMCQHACSLLKGSSQWMPTLQPTMPDPVFPALQAVAGYQELWDCLEDFDGHTCVMDPPQAATGELTN